jgi:hypothetical protein
MSDEIRLTEGLWYVTLAGFRPVGMAAGVKIDINIPADAVRQMMEHGVTGAVAGKNLTVELAGVDLRDNSGPLSLVEVFVTAELS